MSKVWPYEGYIIEVCDLTVAFGCGHDAPAWRLWCALPSPPTRTSMASLLTSRYPYETFEKPELIIYVRRTVAAQRPVVKQFIHFDDAVCEYRNIATFGWLSMKLLSHPREPMKAELSYGQQHL